IGVRRVGWRRKVNGSIMCGVGNGSGLGTLEGGDRWRWTLQESGDFMARDLTRLIEEKIINADNGRLLIHEELDRRGIDLDSTLCPSCGDVVESCSHCLVMCNFARSVWEKIFCWWKIGNVNAFSIRELFSLNGNANVPSLSSKMWQAFLLVRVFAIDSWSFRRVHFQLFSSLRVVAVLFGSDGAVYVRDIVLVLSSDFSFVLVFAFQWYATVWSALLCRLRVLAV
ncbi:RNA-directed DNA polymerase, eukaryota, reverse transcriptase zinc-binding domain protein, partial [Tanacetum coccineum]